MAAPSDRVPHGEVRSTFRNLSPVYESYPGTFEGLRDVDFNNLPLHFSSAPVKHGLIAPLKKGRYERRSRGCMDEVVLEGSHYLPSSETGSEYALAVYNWISGCGSSSQTGIAQIYELRAHRLKVVHQLQWDEHFGASQYFSYDENSKTLVVRSAHYLPGDAHCCVSAMDVVTLRWNGRHLVQKGLHTELSDYGLQEGKKLESSTMKTAVRD
jgi:hypothetical protein